DSLVGKWKHTSGKVGLTIEGTRLHFTCEGKGRQPESIFSLHADYSSTRDQTVFAVITRVEVLDEIARDHYGLVLLDEPICFRVRVEDGVLVIHDMKNIKNDTTRKLLEGVYKPAAAVAAGKVAGKKDEALHRPPNIPTPVPSCGLFGNRLDNFALHDHEGKVWEYKRDRRGRLTLLEFWYHNCGPCLSGVSHLVELQRDFGLHGLDVVSIACESGTVEEQRRNVRGIRGRYAINYTTLLSGGGPGHCPVMDQFQVDYFPLLVLIDADGTILWRSTRGGMDDAERDKLRKMISEKLINKAP
ncbi:MAG: TlpA family protein disulfide reductase, partial [Gemmataceae bacterium]